MSSLLGPNCARFFGFPLDGDFQPFLITTYNKRYILYPNLVNVYKTHKNVHIFIKNKFYETILTFSMYVFSDVVWSLKTNK